MLRYAVRRAEDHFCIWDRELNAECALPVPSPEGHWTGKNAPLQWQFRNADGEYSARTKAENWLAHCYRTWGYRPTADVPFVQEPFRPIRLDALGRVVH